MIYIDIYSYIKNKILLERSVYEVGCERLDSVDKDGGV